MDTYEFRFGVFIATVLAFSPTARTEQNQEHDRRGQPAESHPAQRYAAVAQFFALRTDLVQTDLALTVDQKGEIGELERSMEAIIRDLGQKYLKLSPANRNSNTLHQQIQDAAAIQLKPQIQETLTATQMKRLQGIWLQSLGVAAFYLPEVAQRLDLSEAQQKTIDSAAEEFSRASRYPDDLFGIGTNRVLSKIEREAVAEKYQENYWMAARRAVEETVNVLSADQGRLLEGLWGARIDRRKLSDQQAKMGITVMIQSEAEGLTIQISAGGSYAVASLKVD